MPQGYGEGRDSLGRGGREGGRGRAAVCMRFHLLLWLLECMPGDSDASSKLTRLGCTPSKFKSSWGGEYSAHKVVITLMFPKSHKVSRQRLSLMKVLQTSDFKKIKPKLESP